MVLGINVIFRFTIPVLQKFLTIWVVHYVLFSELVTQLGLAGNRAMEYLQWLWFLFCNNSYLVQYFLRYSIMVTFSFASAEKRLYLLKCHVPYNIFAFGSYNLPWLADLASCAGSQEVTLIHASILVDYQLITSLVQVGRSNLFMSNIQ